MIPIYDMAENVSRVIIAVRIDIRSAESSYLVGHNEETINICGNLEQIAALPCLEIELAYPYCM
jgi:hypothetical protein